MYVPGERGAVLCIIGSGGNWKVVLREGGDSYKNGFKKDKLYVLGDAVDRGPEPIKVLQDMMRRQRHFAWKQRKPFM